MIVDFLNKMNHQNPASNVYKICNFGMAFAEAERSYLKSSEKHLEENITHEKESSLFYREPKMYYMLYEESTRFNYREEFLTIDDFKCTVKFRTGVELLHDKFLPNIHFERMRDQAS